MDALIITAVSANNVKAVKTLLRNKSIDLNKVLIMKECVLNVAVSRDYFVMVKLLVAKGADVNNRNSFTCPLLMAVQYGRVEMAGMLIDLGANIEEGWVSTHKFVPLHYSMKLLNLNMAKLLISKGANVNSRDDAHQTALHCLTKDEETIIMAEGKKEEELQIKTAKALTMKVSNYLTKDQETLVMADGKKEEEIQIKIAKALIIKGADVNAQDCDGRTPMDFAVSFGKPLLCKLYITEGAKVKGIMDDGFIHQYISFETVFRCPELTKLCLERGCDFVSLNEQNLTPYQSSLLFGCFEAVKVFWRFGCPYDQPKDQRVIPILRFYLEHREDISEMLCIQKSFIDGVKNNDMGMIRESLGRGAEPKGCSIDIPSTLHFVVSKGSYELTKFLVEHGVSTNKLNSQGESSLLVAVKKQKYHVCKVLLQFGACYNQNQVISYLKEIMNKTDKFNEIYCLLKEVHKRFQMVKKGNYKILKLLAKYILSNNKEMVYVLMNCTDRRGLTMIGIALTAGHLELANKLMKFRISVL